MASFYAYGYLPGVTRSQGIRLSLSFQRQFMNDAVYYQGNLFTRPRGYKEFISTLYAGGTVDYAFPIYLGDTEWGAFAYLKRLQIIPFVDAGMNYSGAVLQKEIPEFKFSAGTDVLLDAHFLGIAWPVSIGFRYAYTLENPVNFQFLFSANIN